MLSNLVICRNMVSDVESNLLKGGRISVKITLVGIISKDNT
ncbi:hypothetical protein HNQ80_001583 [Anaerosolibacter carboniphilus]|uniref:Uncharacterized protein n=1 Tax=Anaerosolibacter carboniphilus TaxID=1417629 RepID=A0A841KNX2_9FIRM|nr:hypothetical protein [Anaerosolibacter carboniphilus]